MLLLQTMQNFDHDIAREFGGDAFESGFLGVPLVDMTSLWTLLLRFAFHFLVCWVIVRCFYYPKSRRNDYYFTFMLFAVTIFLLIIQMDNMKMAISFALATPIPGIPRPYNNFARVVFLAFSALSVRF